MAVPGSAPGAATYREVQPEDVRIQVEANAPSIVVVRNSYDPGWTATVDGRPTPVLPTDYLLQGVAVPAGHHDVRLVYRDPEISRGLAAGAFVWIMLLGAIPLALALERRAALRRRRPPDAVVP
jgi:uncharacterized membrane protein YfhO